MDAACNDRDWIPARTGPISSTVRPAAGWQVSGKREEARQPASTSVGDGLPDQLGHIDDQIGARPDPTIWRRSCG